MKKVIYILSAVLMASCASNKYAAHFNHYDHHENYVTLLDGSKSQVSSLPAIDPETITASLETKPIVIEPSSASSQQVKKALASMTKQQLKAVKSEIRKEIKKIAAQKDSKNANVVNASGGLDNDLKLAAIFGAIGIVGLILGSSASVFTIIGGIALIIGVVFFVKWLIRQ